jgi:putative transferase (TIGR04331 family)
MTVIKRRILLVTALKDKKKEYLKKPLIAISPGCIKYLDHDFHKLDLKILDNDLKKKSLSKYFRYTNKIYNYYLNKISIKLNESHEVQYSKDYWRIIIGPWLFRFISIVYDRVRSIESAKKNKILYVKINNYSKKDYEFNDIIDFHNNVASDKWNNLIYHQIIKTLEYFPIKKFTSIKENKKKNKKTPNQKLNFIISKFINLFCFLIKKNDIFFINTYFGNKILFFLQLCLLQFPYIANEELRLKFYNRKRVISWNKKEKKNKIIYLLDRLIPDHIPKIYLEGYKKTLKFIDAISWPKKPKFIYSSNSFYNDDIFNIYLAEKKRKYKTKFISGQHGGLYFTSKYNFFQKLQFDISDLFLTWGPKNMLSNKYVPMFNFLNNKKINFTKKGRLLFIDYELSRFPCGIGITNFIQIKQLQSLEDRFDFLKKINSRILNLTTIKMYTQDFGWKTKERYESRGIICNFTKRDDSLFKLLTQSRICVSNFNSTVYLQTLNINFPTIIFFNKNIELMNKEFLLALNNLKDAGVVFYTPEEAANQVNLVWDSIDDWWNSKKVQNSVTIFCNKYSKRSEQKLVDLYNFFKEQ